MAGTAGGKRGHKPHIKCQRPGDAHSSKGLIISELKNRAKDSLHTESAIKVPGAASCRGPELSQQLCTWMAYLFLREPSIDRISIRPQYSSQGSLVSLLALAIICNSILILSPCLFVSLTPPDCMVCESRACRVCLPHCCVCST